MDHIEHVGSASDALLTNDVREHWRWFVLLGALLVALGAVVVAYPFAATLAVNIMLGWLLLTVGIIELVHALRLRKWKGFLFALMGALLSLVLGAVLLLFPTLGILALTLMLATLFLVGGLFRVAMALQLRPSDHWGWILTSGVLALVLAILILFQWPAASAWIIGLFLGIDLIFAGWALGLLGLRARRLV